MPSPELLEFVRSGLRSGKQPRELIIEGMQKNWLHQDISEAINHVILNTDIPAPVPPPAQTVKLSFFQKFWNKITGH